MRTWRSEFAGGFGSRTPLVLAVAALATVAVLVGLQFFVADRAFTVIPEERLLRIRNDDHVHLSYRVAQLKKHPPTAHVVYLFGGSGTMELMRSEESLSAAVSAAAGERVEAVSLAGHAQSMGQTLAIVDNLPRGPGVLAVGVSPNRLTESPQSDAGQIVGKPLALTSPHLAALLAGRAKVSHSLPGLLPGILDFTLSYLKSRASLSKLWLTSIPRSNHYYEDGESAPMTLRIVGSKEEVGREQGLYTKYAAYNLDALSEIIRLGRQRGYTVVLFEQPLAPEARGPAWSALLARYHADLGRVVRQQDVPYIDVQPRAGLQTDDFADLFHLVGVGRDKWTAVFAPRLAHALQMSPGLAQRQ
jgi:hypothetical protein